MYLIAQVGRATLSDDMIDINVRDDTLLIICKIQYLLIDLK